MSDHPGKTPNVFTSAADDRQTARMAYYIGHSYGSRARARGDASAPEAVIAAFWRGSPHVPPPWARSIVEAGIRDALAGPDA